MSFCMTSTMHLLPDVLVESPSRGMLPVYKADTQGRECPRGRAYKPQHPEWGGDLTDL